MNEWFRKQKEKVSKIAKTPIGRGYLWFLDFCDQLQRDHVPTFSGQAAFFLLMSLFPMLIIMLNIARYLPFNEADIITLVSQVIPQEFVSHVMKIIAGLYAKSRMPLLSVSIIIMLWSAARGLQAIANGLDSVYRCEQFYGFVKGRMLGVLYTVIFIVLLVVVLCLFVFGNVISYWLVAHFPKLSNIMDLIIGLRSAFGIVILFIFFVIMYTFMPHRKNKMKHQLYGAAFSAIGWILLAYAFSIYIDHAENFSLMYGSLTTIMLVMLWLYFCMHIVFLGGKINYMITTILSSR